MGSTFTVEHFRLNSTGQFNRPIQTFSLQSASVTEIRFGGWNDGKKLWFQFVVE